jgi:hypothetical protein
MEQRKSEAEVALELMRLVMEQAGSRRLSPTRTLALYHLCKEAVAYTPEGPVTADYLEDNLKKLLQESGSQRGSTPLRSISKSALQHFSLAYGVMFLGRRSGLPDLTPG